jgi:hypothetical protein
MRLQAQLLQAQQLVALSCDAYDTTDKVYYCSVVASSTQAALTTDATEVYTITAATGVTTTASVMFVSGTVSTLTIAGPASANPGEKITYTLTAKNANGNPIPDAAYAGNAFFGKPAASASLVTVPFSGDAALESVTVKDGVATATTFAPFGGALSPSHGHLTEQLELLQELQELEQLH